MDALFIGQAYIDITFLTDRIPSGDEKTIADDYSVSFGGNAVTAAFTSAKLGVVPDVVCQMSDDWLSRMFREMAYRYQITIHSRKVRESSLSFIMPNDGKRAIVRCRDDDYLHPYPNLNLDGCKGLHLDGHMADAALHYARICRESGILTSLDGGAVRSNTDELLEFIDVAVVSERMCEQMRLSQTGMLDYLRSKGVKVGGITLGERGLVWYENDGAPEWMAALGVPHDKVVDTNGAGDVFHGAYMYSAMANPEKSWGEHFDFARSASAHAIQHLGNERSIPSLDDIAASRSAFLDVA